MTVDPTLAVIVVLHSAVCAGAGFAICTARHRQKGLETDEWSTVHTTLPDPEHVDA